MKKIFTIIAVACLAVAMPSQAQVKFGVKGGVNVTNMSLDSDVLDKSNNAGFFIGPSLKIGLPIVGLGVDVSAFYDQRSASVKNEETNGKKSIKQQSINVPINVRYGVGLGNVAGIYFAAGPQFGFNVGKDDFKWTTDKIENEFQLKKSNFSINLGAGVTLLKHLEIGATYNIAMGKTAEAGALQAISEQATGLKKAKTNAWQISAAYYF